MKTLIKWVAILCVLAWVVKNPAQVGTYVHMLFAAGQNLISSIVSALGGALSGATSGGH